MKKSIETSVIIPIFNEENFIEMLLESLISNDYEKEKLEILIFDGNSTDSTLKIINTYIKRYSFIKLFNNPKRIQVEALNLAINKAKGRYIIRCDAHAKYPKNYISSLVEYLKQSNEKIGNIGFQSIAVAKKANAESQAIEIALKSPFGVGFSHRSIKFATPIAVDTLLFGAWKKEVFQDVGLFDTNFIRGQDYEHNKRLLKNGYKVYLLPDITFEYYTRPTIKKLSQMIYQYAYAKAQIIKKYKDFPSIRVIVPALFLFSLLISIFIQPVRWIAILYLTLIIFATLREKKTILVSFYLFISFFIMHLSHGYGFIRGLIDMFIFNKNKKEFKYTR